MIKHQPKVISRQNSDRWVGVLATFFSLALIVLGAVTLVIIQKPLRETQNLSPRASVQAGQVKITTATTLPARLNEAGEIVFKVNTNGVLTNGVQLFFKVKTDTFGDISAELLPDSNLNGSYLEVEEVSDGFLIGLIALPKPGEPFGTTQETRLLKLKFTPTKVGNISLEFDQTKSASTIYNSNPPKDTLDYLSNTTVTVPTGSTQTSTGATCNTACSSNRDCQSNLYCYQGACRMPTNPSDTNCNQPADGGLNRTCNQYCADSRECASGLTCWNNTCRHPQNVSNTSCTTPSAATKKVYYVQCSQACTDDAGCAPGMTCYQNMCRLASNPASTSCSTTNTPTVSIVYQNQTKGGVMASPAPTTKPTATISGQAKPASPAASTKPEIVIPSPSPMAATQPIEEEPTALQSIIANLVSRGEAFPLAMIASGVALLTLIILWLILKSFRSSKPNAPTQARKSSPQEQEYMKQLQQKISSLSQEPTQVTPAMPVERPIMPVERPTQPTPPSFQQSTQPPVQRFARPTQTFPPTRPVQSNPTRQFTQPTQPNQVNQNNDHNNN